MACNAQGDPPTLTHVNNVNAGNATFHWDVFQKSGQKSLCGTRSRCSIWTSTRSGPLHGRPRPIQANAHGWVMPSFLYNANDLAHCFTGIQVTTDGGIKVCPTPRPTSTASTSPLPRDVDGEIDLSSNSPTPCRAMRRAARSGWNV